MGFKSTQITAGGTMTEIQYLQYIIDTITALDDRITCNTTAAEQYADLTSESTASFDFNINNKYLIRFTRKSNNATNSYGFLVSIVVNGTVYNIADFNRMWYTSGLPTRVLNSCYFKVTAITTADNIFLWFGFHHDTQISATFPTNFTTSYIVDLNNNAYCNGLGGSNNIVGQNYYKCSDGSTGFNLVAALAYSETAGRISYIENAPLKNSSSLFAAYIKSLYACSTLALGTSLTLETGETIISVGANFFVLLDEII